VSYSFSALVSLAIMAMTYLHGLLLPAPLLQLSVPLQAVHAFRTVYTTQGSGKASQSVGAIRIETIAILHGTSLDTYSVVTTLFHGQFQRVEKVSTIKHNCLRYAGSNHWQCTPSRGIAPGVSPVKSASLAFQPLGKGYTWTAAGSGTIQGQACQSYTATSHTGATDEVRATLWVSKATNLPVTLQTTSHPIGQAPAKSKVDEQLTWSDWNSPALKIPSV